MKNGESNSLIPAKALFKFTCTSCPGSSRCVLTGVNCPESETSGLTFERVDYLQGSVLPCEYSQVPGFHIIRSGYAMVSIQGEDQKIVKIAGPGDILGFCSHKYPEIHATALSDLSTCFLGVAAFQNFLQNSPQLNLNLIEYMCTEQRKSTGRIAGLAHHSVKHRVKNMLLELARDFGKPSPFGVKIDVKMSRKIMAKLCGAVTETLARVLTELEKEHFIVREKWNIHLVTPASR